MTNKRSRPDAGSGAGARDADLAASGDVATVPLADLQEKDLRREITAGACRALRRRAASRRESAQGGSVHGNRAIVIAGEAAADLAWAADLEDVASSLEKEVDR
jgi:hypothetical protein